LLKVSGVPEEYIASIFKVEKKKSHARNQREAGNELKMEVMSIDFQRTTWRNIPEDSS
jgi:hypothetical protein